MAAILPFHTTAREYMDEQTHVYHDRGGCMEGQRINPMHWTEWTWRSVALQGVRKARDCRTSETLKTAGNTGGDCLLLVTAASGTDQIEH
jgi:mannose/cellobiose epimerase-like protein (N-acyl-D-glucosamine 2-epimerase family)